MIYSKYSVRWYACLQAEEIPSFHMLYGQRDDVELVGVIIMANIYYMLAMAFALFPTLDLPYLTEL